MKLRGTLSVSPKSQILLMRRYTQKANLTPAAAAAAKLLQSCPNLCDPIEESEKVGLKLNIQKTKIMASGPITSWKIDRETVETVRDFIFMGSKITADGD